MQARYAQEVKELDCKHCLKTRRAGFELTISQPHVVLQAPSAEELKELEREHNRQAQVEAERRKQRKQQEREKKRQRALQVSLA